ncbi:hypothetical protein [Autumnicola edwardsiae]|uniref:Uncharacterized protein n=1 Tax=Autumnicola edwardsiae TaxID=3075594 RepID=A0ABU3CTR0_9FLAO|nr:hypothetical protein [Zunongwangia sp. F297]MDT0649749.1 hypothetical protein [Zunongwangia sp. F297]
MAKPIKETPILRGKDARNFVSNNRAVKKVSEEEKRQIKESYNALKGISRFAF